MIPLAVIYGGRRQSSVPGSVPIELPRMLGFADDEDKWSEIGRDKEKEWDEVVVIWYAADGQREVVWCWKVFRKPDGTKDRWEANLEVL